jgi:hypothetical protein
VNRRTSEPVILHTAQICQTAVTRIVNFSPAANRRDCDAAYNCYNINCLLHHIEPVGLGIAVAN